VCCSIPHTSTSTAKLLELPKLFGGEHRLDLAASKPVDPNQWCIILNSAPACTPDSYLASQVSMPALLSLGCSCNKARHTGIADEFRAKMHASLANKLSLRSIPFHAMPFHSLAFVPSMSPSSAAATLLTPCCSYSTCSFRWFALLELGLPYCMALTVLGVVVRRWRNDCVVAWRQQLPTIIVSLSCALMYLIFRQLVARITFYPYLYIYHWFGIADALPAVMQECSDGTRRLALHVAAFLGVDLLYYCMLLNKQASDTSCDSEQPNDRWQCAQAFTDYYIAFTCFGQHTISATHAPISTPSMHSGMHRTASNRSLFHVHRSAQLTYCDVTRCNTQTIKPRGHCIVVVLYSVGICDSTANTGAARTSQRTVSGITHRISRFHPPTILPVPLPPANTTALMV
jgi:hypothetical protein